MELSQLQYGLTTGALTAAFAVMAGTALFFFTQRDEVHRSQKSSVFMAVFYTGVAAFHYWKISSAWGSSFTLTDGVYKGQTNFINIFRYSDWLLTVPVLVAQLVVVLRLDRKYARKLITQLSGAAALMVLLGLPGELSKSTGTKLIFWGAGMIPFAYLVYVLYVGMSGSLKHQPKEIARTVSSARLLLLCSWMTYPIVFMIPLMGFSLSTVEVSRHILYSIADVIAKPAFAYFLLLVARAKSAEAYTKEGNAHAAAAYADVAPSVPVMPSLPTMPSMPSSPSLPSGLPSGMPSAPAAAPSFAAAQMSVPSMPSMPSMPSVSSMPSMPSMPASALLSDTSESGAFGRSARREFTEKASDRMSVIEAAMRDAEFGN
jgi:bacteriorhodopsin